MTENKLTRQIIAGTLGSSRFLLVSMLLENRATFDGMQPTLVYL